MIFNISLSTNPAWHDHDWQKLSLWDWTEKGLCLSRQKSSAHKSRHLLSSHSHHVSLIPSLARSEHEDDASGTAVESSPAIVKEEDEVKQEEVQEEELDIS